MLLHRLLEVQLLRTVLKACILALLITTQSYAAAFRIRNYVFPKYDELSKLVGIHGSLVVEVTVSSDDRITNVEVLSQDLFGPGDVFPKIQKIPALKSMIKGIVDAIGKWELEPIKSHEEIKFQVTVRFVINRKDETLENMLHRFSVRENDGIPVEITIEAAWPLIFT